jgi:hypothetical protein
MKNQEEIQQAFTVLCERLAILRSIPSSDVLRPGGPQTHYYQLIEEAYAAYRLLSSELAALHQQLEAEHQRLEAARHEQLEKLNREEEMYVELQPAEEESAPYESEGE